MTEQAKSLKSRLLWHIAASYPFGINDIEAAYGKLKSYDALIAACEVARKEGHGNLLDYVIKRFKDKPEAEEQLYPTFCEECGEKAPLLRPAGNRRLCEVCWSEE